MCILTQKYRYPSNRDSFSFHIHTAVDSLSISCRLPGCREERKRRSANWQSIFLSSIVVAGPVGESAHSEQQLVWGWFYREYMWAKFRMLLNIKIESVFGQHFNERM